jgi:hypothetical protein
MNAEPQFLLESLSRWDMGWRLSQTDGNILMPVPQDFHTSVEAMHHVKRLSAEARSVILVKISSTAHDGPQRERVVEITQPSSMQAAS